MRAARRALSRVLTVVLALSAVTAITPSALAVTGPSVDAPEVAPVPVTNSTMETRPVDEATTRALRNDQPTGGGTQEGGGSFTATPLSASASWEVSKQSGDFSWSYPLRVPPSPGGFTPSLGLSYRSSAVDGLTSATNNQPSWIGDGWDLSAGFVERAYGGCADDTQGGTTPPKTGDLCWKSDNATTSYAGGGGMLIRDDATGAWRMKSDDRSRVERVTVAGNGDDDGESWKITTVDGTRYFFGSRPESKSTWTVPVFGDDAGEPCHGTTFDASSCAQAWRWNLDKVVDPRGNVILYSYEAETNNYGRNLKDAAVSYVRAGTLKSVEYGLRDDVAAPATGRVEFGLADRCVPGGACAFDRKENWPDVPLDQRCETATCKDRYSPTFWSTKRLSTITTQVREGTAWSNVDRWTLRHEFPKADDVYQAALWLKGIQHTGLVGGGISLPEVTFEGTAMPNRVDTPTGIGPLNRYRVTAVVSEAGGVTAVRYAPPDCVPGGAMPTDAQSNTLRCFPSTWAKKDYAERTDYFHKYVVESITTTDRLASSPEQVVRYEYLDGAAWRYNRSEFTKDDKRTWSDFRGYGRVRTHAGSDTDSSGPVTMTEDRFYRGMHDDHLPGGSRTVAVTDSEGGAREDSDWLSGFRYESATHDGAAGGVVTKSISTPTWSGPTATRGQFKAYFVATGATTSYTALRAGGTRSTKVETAYDEHGQATSVDDHGDLAVTGDEQCTRTTYSQDSSRWMWSYPTQTETVGVGCAATPSFPADAIAGARTEYDTSGNPTKLEVLDQRPESGPVFVTKSTTTYDVYGRPLTIKDAAQTTTTTEYVPGSGGAVTGTVVTNALGHVVRTTIEPEWGTTAKVVDANENTSEAVFDALGRTVKVWQANRLREEFPDHPSSTIAYSVRQDASTAVTTTVLGPRGTYTTGTTVYDGLYRVRQTQTPTDGGRLVVDTAYGSRGQVTRTTQPFYNNAPVDEQLLSFSETVVPGLKRTEYDGVGREVTSIFQGGGQEKWRATIAYGGDRVDITPPPGGTPTTTVVDARGRTTELWQYKGAVASGDHDTTKYGYTRAGAIASTTDAAGNTWRWSYDLQGRQTRAEDVDKGVSTTTYDALGRTDTVTDARGTTLKYGYDVLGRKTTVHHGAKLLQEYTYDTALFGLGQLHRATRHEGGKAYTHSVEAYTELYKPIRSEVTIPEIEGPLKGTYRTEYAYKPDGSPAGTAYGAVTGANLPSETVLYEYDDLGRLVKSNGGLSGLGTDSLVTNTEFTKYGELYRLEIGNAGNRMWQSYYYEDNTRRMNRTIVDAEVASPMQADLRYEHDPAGNVKSVTDETRGQPVDRQCFRYDHLRRMTDAWTPSGSCETAPATASLSGPAPYWNSYAYDETGNRLTEVKHAAAGDTTRTYRYPEAGSPRPHAVSSVRTTGPGVDKTDEYAYDEIGSTVGRPGQVLAWDAEGHVAKVTEGTKITEFLYSADGSRLIRRAPDATTLYLGDQELRLAKGATAPTVTRYYRHGGKTIAMREGRSKLTWLASDHQGTAQIAVDKSTMAVSRRRQQPFGEARGGLVAFPGERGFVGGTNDASTGLVHVGAREYDAALGKFISVDPVMGLHNPQQWNAYAYAENSPVTLSDPTGLASWMCPDGECNGKKTKNGMGHDRSGSNPSTPAPPSYPEQIPDEIKTAEPKYKQPYLRQRWDTLKMAPNMGEVAAQFGRAYCHEFAADSMCRKSKPMTTSERGHLLLDLAGMVPGIGEIADGANAIWYAAEGDVLNASLSASSAVPFWGWLPGAAKIGKAGKACNSFTGDTLVLMSDGTTKRIDQIKVGDKVANSEPESEQTEHHEVLAVIVTDADKDYVDLTVATPDGPKTIRATAHHPIYNATTDLWVDAAELEAGDELNTPGNGRAVIADVRHFQANLRTYNLTVDTVHTYYVLAGRTPLLVHNSNCGAEELAAKIDVGTISMTKTVENHTWDIAGTRKVDAPNFGRAARPYMDSNNGLLLQEIMAGSAPVMDSRGAPGVVEWRTPGSMNGSSGIWELNIDANSNRIVHFLFKKG